MPAEDSVVDELLTYDDEYPNEDSEGKLDKCLFKNRRWLNTKDHQDNGWTQGHVHVYTSYIDASFMIADCSRTITLNFDVWNHSDARNHAKKIDGLIKDLTAMKLALGEAFNLVNKEDW